MKITNKIIWEKADVAVGEISYTEDTQQKVRTYIELKKRVVLIVPIEDDGVWLLREYRPLLKKTVWRLPAGHLKVTEKPIVGAARELMEETGIESGEMTLLGRYDYMGWVKFPMCIIKAELLTRGKQHLEFYEKIQLKKVSKAEAKDIALNKMVEPHHSFALLKCLSQS